MRISSNFDSGSVEVVDAADPSHIRLRLRHDNAASFCQWFHFRVLGVAGTALTMIFENAADAVFADGWPDYRALASYDHRNWFRIATTSANGPPESSVEIRRKSSACPRPAPRPRWIAPPSPTASCRGPTSNAF